jgi:PAS domain S-box-containing protein
MDSVTDDGLGDASRADTALDQVLSGGQSQTVGQFRFFIDDERWEWSDEVQQMHGYAPGSMPKPTTAQVLSHKHPDDYAHVAEALEDTRRTGTAFSTRHRMIDTAGRTHQVVVVGAQLHDDAGAVIGTHGFYIDISPSERAEEDRITAAIAEISDNRAAIEQAKGMLSLLYGVDQLAAFEMLRQRSQESNVKLRSLAAQLVADFRALSDEELPARANYDVLLMTVGQRVRDSD